MTNVGDRVMWQYTHYYNRRSSSERVKKGEFRRQIKHTTKYIRQGKKQLCAVLFDGNKRVSVVPVVDLIKEEKRK